MYEGSEKMQSSGHHLCHISSRAAKSCTLVGNSIYPLLSSTSQIKKKLFPRLLIYYMHQFRKHDTQLINITLNNANKYIILNICNLINFSDRLLIFRLLCDISGRI